MSEGFSRIYFGRLCYRLESPRGARQHSHQQHRPESPRVARPSGAGESKLSLLPAAEPREPRCALRLTSFACSACVVREGRATRPLSFPPGRLDGPSDSRRLDGPAKPDSRGQPHASPADSLIRASGTHSLIPRTPMARGVADGPSFQSGRVGDPRASARREMRTGQRAPVGIPRYEPRFNS